VNQAAAFAKEVFDEWGSGPGPLEPEVQDVGTDPKPGWYPYSTLFPDGVADRLEVLDTRSMDSVVTMVFQRAPRKLIVVDEYQGDEAVDARFMRLYRALRPLAESWEAWDTMATRVGEYTYVLDPRVWPGEATSAS
jgi:hypothetical protein